MSPLALRDAIAKASADVERLSRELIDAEQKVNELLDGEQASAEASGRADAIRALRLGALITHHDLTEVLLSQRCSIHGEAIIVACDQCRRIHGLDRRVA